jgi:hypothetical protein
MPNPLQPDPACQKDWLNRILTEVLSAHANRHLTYTFDVVPEGYRLHLDKIPDRLVRVLRKEILRAARDHNSHLVVGLVKELRDARRDAEHAKANLRLLAASITRRDLAVESDASRIDAILKHHDALENRRNVLEASVSYQKDVIASLEARLTASQDECRKLKERVRT